MVNLLLCFAAALCVALFIGVLSYWAGRESAISERYEADRLRNALHGVFMDGEGSGG